MRAQVAGPLQQVAEAYGMSLVEGVLSHQLKQFVIDGNKCVLARPNPEYRVEDGEFEANEVYGIDIVVRAAAEQLQPAACTAAFPGPQSSVCSMQAGWPDQAVAA